MREEKHNCSWCKSDKFAYENEVDMFNQSTSTILFKCLDCGHYDNN